MVKILGDVTGLGKSFTQAGQKGQSAAQGMHSAFSGMLGQLNSSGVLGPFGNALQTADQSMQNMGEHAKSTGLKMAGIGGAAAGVGLAVTAMASKDQAAHAQLQAAIQATGHSYDQYGTQVEAAIGHEEKFGNTADETQGALRVLTSATHDPTEALKLLNTATDLAAAKHEDLTAAAGQLGKAYNGSARIFKEFGITVTKNTDGTKDYHKAIGDLGNTLGGQASAQANTFTGHLHALRAEVTDHVSLFAQKYGPAISAAGIAMVGLGSAIEITKNAVNFLKIAEIGEAIASGVATAATWLWNAALTATAILEAIVGAPIWLIIAAVVAFVAAVAAAAFLIVKYWGDISAAVGTAVSFMHTVWSDFVNFFTGIPGQIAGIASGMWNSIGNAFVDVLNFVIGAWDRLHFKTPSVDIFGFHTPSVDIGMPSIPKIPHMAQGGLITASGLIYAHAGEAITPAPAGSSGPAVVVNNAHFSSGVDVDAFMRRAAWVARNRL
jgi:hypothetical protein